MVLSTSVEPATAHPPKMQAFVDVVPSSLLRAMLRQEQTGRFDLITLFLSFTRLLRTFWPKALLGSVKSF
ncbi:hypothetical protein M7I_4207 [Glarea lozoyensis 74030]|uniref:Uncharacterized protein n=1 Tax=Glarea lozoyensis (strain ATCC 74030 / MF5533) TaxID=1104152 RepID=H0ENK0_GLAL7|nr:hypothetical protein M7I_4207 [Glarea lozoyensis 74030]